jgi:hypothetical protein
MDNIFFLQIGNQNGIKVEKNKMDNIFFIKKKNKMNNIFFCKKKMNNIFFCKRKRK